MARRLVIPVVAAALVLTASPALADQPVEDLIMEGTSTDFRGRGVVLTTWGTATAAATMKAIARALCLMKEERNMTQ